jgi:DNA-binding transcriptional LysR family regulator
MWLSPFPFETAAVVFGSTRLCHGGQRPRTGCIASSLSFVLTPAGVTRSIGDSSRSTIWKFSMAEQCAGIACLPDFAIGRQLREGVLVTVLDDYTDYSGTLRVLWPSSRHLSPKLRVFVDFLAANLFPLWNATQRTA